MLAQLAYRTGRLPSEWESELEHNERAVWTVFGLLEQDDSKSSSDE
jgi:hypothetical protein